MLSCQLLPCVGQLPETAPTAGGQPRTLQPVVGPSHTILVDELRPAREHFGTVGLADVQGIGRRIMDVTRKGSLWVTREVLQHRPNKLIVGGNCHLLIGLGDFPVFEDSRVSYGHGSPTDGGVSQGAGGLIIEEASAGGEITREAFKVSA